MLKSKTKSYICYRRGPIEYYRRKKNQHVLKHQLPLQPDLDHGTKFWLERWLGGDKPQPNRFTWFQSILKALHLSGPGQGHKGK